MSDEQYETTASSCPLGAMYGAEKRDKLITPSISYLGNVLEGGRDETQFGKAQIENTNE